MKRPLLWNRTQLVALLVAGCQAPDAAFFDQPLSPGGEPRLPPSMASGGLQGSPNGASGQAPVATAAPPSASPPALSTATPSSPPPSDGSPSDDREGVPPPSPSGPDARGPDAPSDAGAPGLEPPPCASEACSTCRAQERCESGLVCHPQLGECVVPCSTSAACEASSGTPICAGTDERVLGVCVECGADLDCGTDDLPVCDQTAGRCVECSSDQHCADQGSDENVCDVGRGLCVECVTDADCDADTPVCSGGECEDGD